VTVDGLLFHGGAIAEGSVIQFNSHHGIVRNTAIVDYNPAAFDTRYYWVFFSGDNNVVDHCYFKGKSNLEPVIGNAIDDSRHNSVVHSLFKNVPYVPKANGREIIRVWGSGKVEERDDDGAYFTIDGNLFDHADGEGVEIVSLKSNHNVVQHNTVVATRGGLNIRRGNFNTVRENVVLGQGIDGADGLRMSGRDNVVAGNFVSGCGYGIRVACGEFIAESLTPAYSPDVKPNGKKNNQVRIPTYPQVVWLTLADNVVVASAGLDLEIGSDYKKHWPESQQVLLPENCRIENNRFVRPHGGASVAVTAADTKPPLDRFKFKANHFAGNVVVGASAAPEGFAQQPADGGAETPERYGLKPLTLQEVGPAWVIALRSAGKFAMEDAVASVPAAAPETPKKKKGG
jgi:poly(beta-D-mannuronate) lyase